ncbi:hypothetical protein [Halorubrum sp. Atlit-26R]|uniref:hypothetical protein n=1 Tax=Halorubrum sp. Atlit-26R TaxID=2282128 RepID=UPI000EF179E3|nr:hypothetical protein [Halorubrum sp. Atlit-26R]RLM68617.1 hypothetical protein DVK07_10885 [Halorubrum sp. Atlit-26R]
MRSNGGADLDAIVDLVAENEPVVPEDVPELLDEEIDVEDAERYLSVAEERGRVLKVNGNYWVMRIGKYAANPG